MGELLACTLSEHPLSKQRGALIPSITWLIPQTFLSWNFIHTVVFLHFRNTAYFLLQMSTLGIYLLNCNGRKIIHISVIRHVRNTSQNPILLVNKKGGEKSYSLILCRFKSPPWGFLFIYFRFFSPSLFCLWIEQQHELVYTHNAEQIKNKDDRGKRWVYCSSR